MAHFPADDDTFISKLSHQPQRYQFQNAFVTPDPPGYYGKEGELYFIVPGVQLGGGGGLTGMPRVVWQEGPFFIIRVPGTSGWCQLGASRYYRTEYLLLELLEPHAADDRRPDIAYRGDKWRIWGEGRPGRQWKRCLDQLKDHALQKLANMRTKDGKIK